MKMNRTALHYIIVTLVLTIAFGILTALYFPSTYIFLEGDNFWAWTRFYWNLKLSQPPALTGWVADFLMQFYSNVAAAACIQASAVGLIALLAGHFLGHLFPSHEKLSWLGLIPAAILGFYSTFDLWMHLQVASLFLALVCYMSIRQSKLRLAFGILMLPLGYMLMVMPLLGIMLLSLILMEWKVFGSHNWKWQLAGWPLLWLLPIIYSQQVAFIPFQNRYTEWGSYLDPITSKVNTNLERVKSYVLIANEGRWADLLYKAHCKRDAQRGDGMALRFALLAESELGTLPENLIDYPITDENQFLFPHQREYFQMQFNRLFYLNLGIYDEAFHHAQEYYLQQHNGICFQSLRQMVDYSIEEGEWEVAEKLLCQLEQSTCHKTFVKEKRELMAKAKGHVRKPIALRADNFVGGYTLPVEMLRLERYFKDSPHRKKMVDYAICSYIIRGDMKSFRIALNAYEFYKDKELPRTYKIIME